MARNLFATQGRNLFAEESKPRDLFAETIAPVVEPEDRTIGETVGDLWASYASGANSLLKIGGDIYGLATGDMENFASEQGASGVEYWRERKSPQLLQAEENRKNKIAAADNELGKAGTAFWETLSSATLLTSFMFEQAPMLLPGAGIGRIAGAGAKAVGASQKIAAIAATGGAIGSGALMSGADSGSQAHEKLTAIPDSVWRQHPDLLGKEGQDYIDSKDELMLDLSQNAAIATAITSGVTNMLPGAKYLEKSIAGVKLPGGSRIANTVVGFLGETAQEGLEEGFSALSANIAAQRVDNDLDILAGVGEQAGLGMAAGPFGAIAGAVGVPLSAEEELANEMNRIVEGSGFSTPAERVASRALSPEQDMMTDISEIGSASTAEEAIEIASRSVDEAELTTSELLNIAAQEDLPTLDELTAPTEAAYVPRDLFAEQRDELFAGRELERAAVVEAAELQRAADVERAAVDMPVARAEAEDIILERGVETQPPSPAMAQAFEAAEAAKAAEVETVPVVEEAPEPERPLSEIRVSEDVITETGETALVTRSADVAIQEIDSRIDGVKLLSGCIGK